MKKNEFFREDFTQRRKDAENAENAEEEKGIGIFIIVQLFMINLYFFFASLASFASFASSAPLREVFWERIL